MSRPPAPTHRGVRPGPLPGAVPLWRASVRHDGRLLAPWILLPALLSSSSVLLYPWLFPDPVDRQGLAAAVGANPALGLVLGPARDLLTDDGFTAWRSLALGGLLTGLGAVFAVIRATRAQEDSGQAELLASGVLGRSSRLLVAIALGLLLSVLAGALSALLTVACGGGGVTSLLLGAGFTATGALATALAAVTAQLGSDARTATTLAVTVLGGLYVLRGVAYAMELPEWMLWANPLGWLSETQPATEDRWWPLAPAVALAAAGLALAIALQARRDFGQGLIAPGPGPARGHVRTPWGLARRLHRGTLLTWTIAMLLLGAVFGSFATSVQDLLAGDSAVQQVLAAGATTGEELVRAVVMTILSLLGIFAAVPGVLILLRARAEELEDRLEPVLAGAVTRPRLLLAHVGLALAASALCLLLAGGVVAGFVAASDLPLTGPDVLWQAVATIPAVWTVVALSVAVVGARPIAGPAAWAGVVLSFGLTLLGPTFRLPDWALSISPFHHVPDVAAEDPAVRGLLVVSLVALVLLAVGVAGFRGRDVPA